MLLGPRGLFLVSSRFGNTKTGVGDMDISLDEIVSAWHQHGTHVDGFIGASDSWIDVWHNKSLCLLLD